MTSPAGAPSRRALAGYFLRLGLVGFGGPAALADRMRLDLVDRRGWIAPDEYRLGLAVAAACPGPLAYQLAVYCGYVRHGAGGAAAVAVAFALAPFLLVCGAAAGYARWQADPLARGLFDGAAPVVVALVARAAWSLARTTLTRSGIGWMLAAAGFLLTWRGGSEPTSLFLAAGAIGALMPRPAGGGTAGRRPTTPPGRPTVQAAFGWMTATTAAPGPSFTLFAFFFKTGCLVFGSGLVIVPFLRHAVVDTQGWLTPDQFLDSVTVGLVSPGPVVITATFVGYLVNGLAGALAATVGMFLPAVLFTVVATPFFLQHHQRPRIAGVVQGIAAAVVGVLAGTVPLVAETAVTTPLGATLLIIALVLAVRRILPEPMLVLLGAAIGVVAGGG